MVSVRWPGYVGEVEGAASTGAVRPVRMGPVEAVRPRWQTSRNDGSPRDGERRRAPMSRWTASGAHLAWSSPRGPSVRFRERARGEQAAGCRARPRGRRRPGARPPRPAKRACRAGSNRPRRPCARHPGPPGGLGASHRAGVLPRGAPRGAGCVGVKRSNRVGERPRMGRVMQPVYAAPAARGGWRRFRSLVQQCLLIRAFI